MQVVCRNCGSVDNYITEFKGNQNVAHCNSCGKFIKNIPYKEPTLYFGKYKDKKVSEIQDMQYLQWLIDKSVVRANIKDAVVKQIERIKIQGV
jgi:ribosomal protein L34E